MDKRIITIVFLLVLPRSVDADIYKCLINGKVVFSDKTCADNAEKIDIWVYQPKPHDIEQQQRTTELYQKDSKHNDILVLRSQNESLKTHIKQLYKQRDAEIKTLEKKTYRYSDSHIATSEPGLFRKIRAVAADYQARIQQSEAQIRQNEHKMSQIRNQ